MTMHSTLPSDSALRVKAIQSLLIEKGLMKQETNDHLVDYFENKVGPRNGAKVVAKAWCDAEYKKRLLANGREAIAELGFSGFEASNLLVVENSDKVHNIVVCTLCSCYPWPVLGLPPMWFKTAQYRSRVVIDPHSVLREFGTTLGDDVEIRIWDSNAEIRYLVLPQRPAGTEHLSEAQLAERVTRDAMIGTTLL